MYEIWYLYLSYTSRYWSVRKDIVINKVPITPPWLLAMPAVNLRLPTDYLRLLLLVMVLFPIHSPSPCLRRSRFNPYVLCTLFMPSNSVHSGDFVHCGVRRDPNRGCHVCGAQHCHSLGYGLRPFESLFEICQLMVGSWAAQVGSPQRCDPCAYNNNNNNAITCTVCIGNSSLQNISPQNTACCRQELNIFCISESVTEPQFSRSTFWEFFLVY